ncbi:MAG TPA: PKD domain-containing protein, partial [Thermoplasmata archaeon]
LTLLFNQTVAIRLNGSSTGGRFSVGPGPPVDDRATVFLEQSGPTEYPLLALPPSGGALAGWTGGPAAALWPDPAGAIDTVLANDSGNLTARIVAALPLALAVDLFPAQTGTVRFDLNRTLTNASTTFDVAPGTLVVEALPAPGYVFWGWGTQGGATVVVGGPPNVWPVGSDRLVVASGNPVLDAYFVAATYPLTFVSNPPGATATVGGNPVTNGQTLVLGLGTFSLRGTLSTGGEIGGWTSSPNLAITGTPGNYSVVVGGPGAIYAAGTGALDGTVLASPVVGTAPLPVRFQAIPLNGTPAYSFDWNFGDGTTATGSSPLQTFESGGAFTVGVWINDSASATAYRTTSIDVTFALLQPQVSANVSSGTAPLWVAFSGSVSGGSAPYLFAWDFGDGSGVATGPNVTYEFTAGGDFTVTMTVHDSVGSSAGATQLISVQYVAPLVVLLTADRGRVTLGDTVRLNGVVSGGRAPYQYDWSGLPMGCTPPSGPELTCTPAETGTFNVSLRVMDGSGATASGATLVEVVSGSGGHGVSPVGLLGVPEPYGLALILTAVVVGLAIASLLVYRRRRRPPSAGAAPRAERETVPEPTE